MQLNFAQDIDCHLRKLEVEQDGATVSSGTLGTGDTLAIPGYALELIAAPSRSEDVAFQQAVLLRLGSEGSQLEHQVQRDCFIRAPFDGEVLQWLVEPQEWIDDMQPQWNS